eukprot:8032273-Lingulodinium_polyedra.AAC.1
MREMGAGVIVCSTPEVTPVEEAPGGASRGEGGGFGEAIRAEGIVGGETFRVAWTPGFRGSGRCR